VTIPKVRPLSLLLPSSNWFRYLNHCVVSVKARAERHGLRWELWIPAHFGAFHSLVVECCAVE
jgi:hypothetical protein